MVALSREGIRAYTLLTNTHSDGNTPKCTQLRTRNHFYLNYPLLLGLKNNGFFRFLRPHCVRIWGAKKLTYHYGRHTHPFYGTEAFLNVCVFGQRGSLKILECVCFGGRAS